MKLANPSIKSLILSALLLAAFLGTARAQTVSVQQPHRDAVVGGIQAVDAQEGGNVTVVGTNYDDINTDLGQFTNPETHRSSGADTSLAHSAATVYQDSTITLSPTNLQVTACLQDTANLMTQVDPRPAYGSAIAEVRSLLQLSIFTDAPLVFTLTATTTHVGNWPTIYQPTFTSYVSLSASADVKAEFGEISAGPATGTTVVVLPAGGYDLYAAVRDDGAVDFSQSASDVRTVNFALSVRENEWKGGGNWGGGGNGVWTGEDPHVQTMRAKFGTAASGGTAGTVAMNQDRTVKSLLFDNANSYTISGTHALTLDAGLYNSIGSYADIVVKTGAHTIAPPLTLKNDLEVSDTAGTALTISGDITAAAGATSTASARTVTMNGTGTLTLSGLQDYATLITNSGITNIDSAQSTGALAVEANATTNFGTSQTLAALVIGDGAVVTLGDARPDASFPQTVPEPGAFALLLGSLAGLLASRRRTRRNAY